MTVSQWRLGHAFGSAFGLTWFYCIDSVTVETKTCFWFSFRFGLPSPTGILLMVLRASLTVVGSCLTSGRWRGDGRWPGTAPERRRLHAAGILLKIEQRSGAIALVHFSYCMPTFEVTKFFFSNNMPTYGLAILFS